MAATQTTKQGDPKYQLSDNLLVDANMSAEAGLEVLEDWLDKPIYKVEVNPSMSYGIVTEAERGNGKEFAMITQCPPSLVHHFRQLLFNREKTGRLLFYFSKVIAKLEGDEVPSWFEFAANALVEMTTKGGKKVKGAKAESTAIRRNWRKHLAQYFIFQSKLLKFYQTSVDVIVIELKSRKRAEKNITKWKKEVWQHTQFMEYIVRERWGAWDTNDINDDRWETCQNLHPLHPDNKEAVALDEAEVEVEDAVPASNSWVLADFVEPVGEHRNRYAQAKYNMVMFAKLTKRGPATSYSLSPAKVNDVFEELRNSEENIWTKASWGTGEDAEQEDIFADEDAEGDPDPDFNLVPEHLPEGEGEDHVQHAQAPGKADPPTPGQDEGEGEQDMQIDEEDEEDEGDKEDKEDEGDKEDKEDERAPAMEPEHDQVEQQNPPVDTTSQLAKKAKLAALVAFKNSQMAGPSVTLPPPTTGDQPSSLAPLAPTPPDTSIQAPVPGSSSDPMDVDAMPDNIPSSSTQLAIKREIIEEAARQEGGDDEMES